MKDILTLEKMLTPKLITGIYWVLLLVVVVFGVKAMFGSYQGFGLVSLFLGVVGIVVGALVVRVWCELFIVLFKMNEALQDIRNK
ncbi:DUF4282 domain-containing protein [Granulosicoccaceae sp. 1_MG-2023]|nr:DUF4282 domain-containing protein [Granulosicoccaceae sp. 1_MG-2023]